ncbi:MAG: carboxypeptidase-like regulatory domain-containing protein [bacterium]
MRRPSTLFPASQSIVTTASYLRTAARVFHSTLVFLVVLSLLPRAVAAQSKPETIRGRVVSEAGVAIAGATVSATMGPERVSKQALTALDGRFELQFENGTGDYLIHVAAVGFGSRRQRLTRAPSDTALLVTIRLTPEVAKLAAVNVSAQRIVPIRGTDDARDIGAVSQRHEGVFAALTPDQEGNLSALANSIPGVRGTANGLSAFGLGGEQSNVTLNGMDFGGATLPRDARTTVRIATSTYDPARGGFSGGQTAIELGAGGKYDSRTAHVTIDAPALQATDERRSRLGQSFTSLNASVGGSGELVPNKWFYNSGFQASRRMSDIGSLFSLDALGLSAIGVSPDSVQRLQQLLMRAQVPLSARGVPAQAITQTATLVTRFDHKPLAGDGYAQARETWNITIYGNVKDDQASGVSPTSVATQIGRNTALQASTQANYSRLFGDVLNDTRTAFSVAADRGSPYLRLPSGNVSVPSQLSDGTNALTTVAFGGSGAGDDSRHAWSWETINETQWHVPGRPHRLKVTAEAKFNGYSVTPSENVFGSFSFNSLDALALGRPSEYSRTLTSPERAGGEWSSFLALGDYWRVTPGLQVLYGARLEGNRYTTALRENQALESALGANTNQAPSTLHLSPRMGFTWFFGGGSSGGGTRVNPVAEASIAPTSVLRGGVGEFRGSLQPELLSQASVANGLPGGLTRVTCLGPSVPVPQWANYASNAADIPATCANGAATAFSDLTPSVQVVDRSYDAARSWRGNLSLTRAMGPFSVTVDGTVSRNLNQTGTLDLNFGGQPRFVLQDEGARPVYVSPSSIVATSGLPSPVEARTSPAFGRVVSLRSDLTSTSQQLTTSIVPSAFGAFYYSLAYTLGTIQSNARGFDASTFGDPRNLESGAGDFDIRHQLLASLGRTLPHGMNVAIFGRFMSGTPYTPMIGGDVNGDGLANDRAFIFDPNHASDPAVAAGMRSLLSSAPREARACLDEQSGRAAIRNSCRGPWTATVNARVGVYTRSGFLKRLVTAVLNVTNPLGGIDQLLHGSDAMRGWGSGARPDNTLLTVRGFDAATNRMQYAVNPRFGSTSINESFARTPFRVTLDVRIDLGVPTERQQAIQLFNPGRAGRPGKRLSGDSAAFLVRRQVPNIYRSIMRETDSLLVSREQMDALAAAEPPYRLQVDAIWKRMGQELNAMNDDYDPNVAAHIIEDATEEAWVLNRDQLPILARILSPIQMTLAPWVADLQKTVGRKEVGIRLYFF